MKDITVKKQTKVTIQENPSSVSKFVFTVPSFSLHTTLPAYSYKKISEIAAKVSMVLAVVAISSYIVSVTAITVFAVAERSFIHKNEKMLVTQAASSPVQEVDEFADEEVSAPFEQKAQTIAQIETDKVTHLTMIRSTVGDRNFTQR